MPFVAELSAIAARGADGAVAVYDAVENRHRDHILDLSFAPARLPAAVAAAARAHAAAVAGSLELVGVLALELFLLPDGSLLGNEIAPRPHNSGHWTMDGCAASQFEQHIRAVAGPAAGGAGRHHDVVMLNLVGPEGIARWPALLRQAGRRAASVRQGGGPAGPQAGACEPPAPARPLAGDGTMAGPGGAVTKMPSRTCCRRATRYPVWFLRPIFRASRW